MFLVTIVKFEEQLDRNGIPQTREEMKQPPVLTECQADRPEVGTAIAQGEAAASCTSRALAT